MDTGDYMMMQNALSSFNNTLANNANVLMASNMSKSDQRFSEKMSNLAWERNLEAWRMQNEYNLPSAQYQRQLEGLKANGLNPNLVYGNSSSVGGAAGSVSPYRFEGYHSTAVPRFSGPEPVQSLLTTQLLQSQVAASEANARLISARADNEAARGPGISAKSDYAAAHWNYILSHLDDEESAWRSEQALRYWKGQAALSTADILKNKASMSYIDAAMAEWLNTTNVPGLDMTYRQYMDSYSAMLPAAQFQSLKAAVLNVASQIAFRSKQGKMIDLKMEYQRYANYFARFGRSIGDNWLNLVLSGMRMLFGDDWTDKALEGASDFGESWLNMPATYPGP